MSLSSFFLAASSGFLCGLFLRVFLSETSFGAALFLAALVSVGIVVWRECFQGRLVLFLISLLLGVFHMDRTLAFWESEETFHLDTAEVRVVGYPIEKGFYKEVRLKVESCRAECPEAVYQKNILWQAPLGKEIGTGEQFLFSCELRPVENFQSDFDYRLFLAKEGVGFLCKKAEEGERVSASWSGYLGRQLFVLRQTVEKRLERIFLEPEAGLAKGLLLGGGSFLGESLEEDFRRIGMTHIVAVSGYNILLVAGGFLFLGNRLGLWRRQTLVLALGGVALFVCLVGAPASALRAGMMAAIAFLARATGRLASWFTGILFALTVMLFQNPLLIRYDIGFQLSFLAVLGIIVATWGDEFSFLSGEKTWRVTLWQAFLATLWVELFVLPLLLYHFGTLAWFSLFANVLLLPVVPLAMFASFGALVLSFLLPIHLAFLWAWPAYLILFFLTRFAEFFGNFSFIAFENLQVSPVFLLVWYALLVSYCIFRFLRKERAWYAKAFLSAS